MSKLSNFNILSKEWNYLEKTDVNSIINNFAQIEARNKFIHLIHQFNL